MKYEFQYSILSWCEDLTDPNAESFPIFFILYGEHQEDSKRIGALEGMPFSYEEEHDYNIVFRIADSLEKEGWDAFDWISDIRGNLYTSENQDRFEVTSEESFLKIFSTILTEKSPLPQESIVSIKSFKNDNNEITESQEDILWN